MVTSDVVFEACVVAFSDMEMPAGSLRGDNILQNEVEISPEMLWLHLIVGLVS